jgi:dihydrofolate synthase/folylpolyglutamate synthase
MNFQQSLAYLDALIGLGVQTGLDHTRHLAARLGNPQLSYPCILVAGTNGKGSTASFLTATLSAAGFHAGLYTSPHLVDVRERIRTDGGLIGEAEFASSLSLVREEAEAAVAAGELPGPPTYFEALTLLAFEHFRRRTVSVAVLEVGLGGRLDCTNVSEPVLSIVTNIALDHEDYLGLGLQNIAREKAGIFRTAVPALTAAKEGPALETLRRRASELGTPLGEGRDCRIQVSADSWRVVCGCRTADLPLPFLPGRHQLQNAALAVRAAWTLGDLGWRISPEAIREGIAAARWPGRLERTGEAPDLYLDGAHNPDGCEALAAFVSGLPHRRKALVFTAMRDKPVRAMLAALAPSFDTLWTTRVPMARCLPSEELASAAEGIEVRTENDPMAALAAARSWAGPEGLVVVAGSLYLVGWVKSRQEDGTLSKSWGSGL